MGTSLLYEDPLYLMNYAYAGLLAVKSYQMYTTDPVHFRELYIALLQNGFTASPAVLVKQFLGIDLSSARLVDDDMAVIDERIHDLSRADSLPPHESRSTSAGAI